ncbi:MAG TPA: hypothetical protein DCE48_08620, partial [Lachnospiraceae bacterium]|nr:hypothetical protein [Lachnospiraceae bacterium]
MATSTEIIRDYINKNIKELDREIISKEETYANFFDKRNVDVVRTETGEDVIISYSDISITGTDRAKPQIRVFMDKQKNVYENARMRKMRYFLLTIFSKDNAMAKNINNFDPHDFIVAIETNVDNENSRRDLRSLYDYLDDYIKENGDVDYLRCTQGQHQSGIYQASFIRIKKDGIDTPIFLKNYITYFDNRPYMSSIDETIGVEEKERVNAQYNRIVFGAPGTGKSHRLDDDSKSFGSNMERVTFHPNYAYSQFVGTYKPVMEKREGKKEISYQYIPGPFMRVFLKAQKSILINSQYKDLENINVYYEPATSMEHWNLFEEIQKEGDIESFKATKDMKKGDIALVYIGNNSFGYDNGIYAIAKVISNPEIDASEEDGALRVTLRFDKISYDKPIISKEKLDEYNTQYQSVHRIDNAKQLIQEISFAVEDELLLIEEINRANVAAVFGDVFQLLDRKNGVSEYSIATSEDLKNYLDEELWMYEVDNTEIRIPSNMFIWATMNSADQGVFPMDTAFKRRWEFEYIGIDEEENEVTEYVIPIGTGENRKYVYWNELRKKINSILSQEENRINEDKLLGPF